MCARDIILYNDSSKYIYHLLVMSILVQYCLNRLDELISEGLVPYVVFDGADLPIKDNTNESRRE